MQTCHSVRSQVEELISEHYNDVEIQSIMKKRSIAIGINYINKIRDDMFTPLNWRYDDPRWDNIL